MRLATIVLVLLPFVCGCAFWGRSEKDEEFSAAHGDFLRKTLEGATVMELSVKHVPGQELDDSPGEYDNTQAAFGVRLPYTLDRDTFVYWGAAYEARYLDVDSSFSGLDGDDTLHSLAGQIGISHFVNDGTMIMANLYPGIWSDFDGTLKSDDYQLNAEGRVVWRQNEDLFWRAGLYVGQDFDDALIIPTLGLVWNGAVPWRFDVLLPQRAMVYYDGVEKTTLYGGLKLRGSQYRWRTSNTFGKQEFDVAFREVSLLVGGRYMISDQVSGFLELGSIVGGETEFEGPGNSSGDDDMEPAPFIKAGVGIFF